jgi:pentatricopeptide repeat protein
VVIPPVKVKPGAASFAVRHAATAAHLAPQPPPPTREAVANLCEDVTGVVSSLMETTSSERLLMRYEECMSWLNYICRNPSVEKQACTAKMVIENQIALNSIVYSLLKADLAMLLHWHQRITNDLQVFPQAEQVNQILRKIGLEGTLPQAKEFLNTAIDSKHFIPDTTTMNIMIQSCSVSNDFDGAFQIMQSLSGKFDIRPNVVTMNTIIQMFCNVDDKENSMHWFSTFTEECKIRPDPITVQTMLYMLARLKDTVTAFKLIHYVESVLGEKIAHTAITRILAGCKEAGDVESMEQWMLFAKDDLDLIPDASMCTLMVSAYASVGNAERAFYWFQEMKEEYDISPTHSSFLAVIKAFTQAGDMERAEELWSSMVNEHRIHPRIDVFNVLIQGHARAGNASRFRSLLDNMTTYGLHPNSYTATIAVDHYTKVGDLDQAAAWTNVLLYDLNTDPLDVVKLQLVQAFSKAGLMDDAVIWFRKLHEKSLPSVSTYTTLLDGYAVLGDKHAVLEILAEMDSVGVNPSLVTMNCVLKGIVCCPNKGFDIDEMNYYLHLITHHYGFKPDLHTFYSLVVGSKRLARPEAASKYCKLMIENGVPCDFRTLKQVLLTLGPQQFKLFYQSQPALLEMGDIVLKKMAGSR